MYLYIYLTMKIYIHGEVYIHCEMYIHVFNCIFMNHEYTIEYTPMNRQYAAKFTGVDIGVIC